MDPASSNDVFSAAMAALLTPFGLIAVVLALLITVATLASRGWRWGMLAVAIWLTTFELAAGDQAVAGHLWGPLESIQSNGRFLATAAMLALLLPSIFSSRGWRVRMISGAAVAYLLLEFVYGGRLLLANLTERALGSFGIFILIFIILARGVSTWLQEPGHAVAALRAVAFAGMIFVAVNIFQLLISPHDAIWNGRLNGTAGNPQHMAMDMASLLPAMLFLLLRKEEPKAIRVCLSGTVGLMAIMLGMTASRTGALMVLFALVVMFRRWLGKFLKMAVIICVVTFLGSLLFPDSRIDTYRFTSTENTRGDVWSQLSGDFLSHPLIGVVYDAPDIRESSYLSVAARLGVVGLLPLLAMIILGFRTVFSLRRARPMLGEYTMIADVIAGGMVSLAVGAMTEGFMLGTLTLQVYMIYFYLSLTLFLLDFAQLKSLPQESPENSYETSYEEFYIGAYDL